MAEYVRVRINRQFKLPGETRQRNRSFQISVFADSEDEGLELIAAFLNEGGTWRVVTDDDEKKLEGTDPP